MEFLEKIRNRPIIIDNFFDSVTISTMYQMAKTVKYSANHKSVNSQLVYESAFVHYFNEDFENSSFCKKVKNKIESDYNIRLKLDNAYIHSYGVDHKSKTHIDNSTPTVIYYINPQWEVEWGAQTFIMNKDEIAHCITPKAGRLLIFDGNMPHVGMPTTFKAPDRRWALVFKFRFIDDKGNELNQIPFVEQ